MSKQTRRPGPTDLVLEAVKVEEVRGTNLLHGRQLFAIRVLGIETAIRGINDRQVTRIMNKWRGALQKFGDEYAAAKKENVVKAVPGLLTSALVLEEARASVALDGETQCVLPDPNEKPVPESQTCWNCGPKKGKTLPKCRQCKARFCGLCFATQVLKRSHTSPEEHFPRRTIDG